MQKFSFFLQASACILVTSFFSCSEKNNNDEILKRMEESLINSSKVINLSTMTNLKALEQKTTDPATMERAKIWFAKAEQVVKLSTDIYNHLEKGKIQMKEDGFSADSLYQQLVNYKTNILIIDSSIWQEFRNNFDFLIKNKPVKTSQSLVTLQNDIKVVENKITTYFNTKVTSSIFSFDTYSVIVGQNSTYLKAGEIFEINAGIGAFSRKGQPVININGENIELGEAGYALFKTKVQKIPGQYKIPVKIDFFNQTTGKQEIHELNVEYTVTKECNQ